MRVPKHKGETMGLVAPYLDLSGFQALLGSQPWLEVVASASLCVILLVVLDRSALTKKLRGEKC
ncbi:hypothetical protein AKJ40_03870 [candidate division MSBL1 archaeon SCGC-AAA259M10]|uniref:Uncharacterized protein n=1 Tax=candidate division MSBL1 archaeon SCGC-AAA259M10 TaxID=1698270 RepID=A0A133UY77_9EURY|nr:hypothetical protein AKJ40_03870 [candidate division MSBL1 archaeon SCGC-AAA259M10]